MSAFTSIDGLKRQAKALKKAEGIKHLQALDRVAQQGGYKNYTDARRKLGEGHHP